MSKSVNNSESKKKEGGNSSKGATTQKQRVNKPSNKSKRTNNKSNTLVTKAPAQHPKRQDRIASIFEHVSISSAITRISREQLVKVLEIDGALLSDQPKRYIRDNVTSYDLVISSWMMVLCESMGHTTNSMNTSMISLEIIDCIIVHGLVYVIHAADELAKLIVEANLQPALFYLSVEEAATEKTVHAFLEWISYFDISKPADVATILQGLRYPKRFSPQHTEKLEGAVLDDFLHLERVLAMSDRRRFGVYSCEAIPWDQRYPYTYTMPNVFRPIPGINTSTYMEESAIAEMKEEISRILQTFSVHEGYFSNGSINDGFKSPAAKLSAALCKGDGYLAHPLLEQSLNTNKHLDTTFSTKWMTVNKNTSTRRSIAVEEAGRQWSMQGIQLGLTQCLYENTNVTLDDQSRNQILAKKGAVSGELATIDLSAASDHVSWGLVHATFPSNIFSLMDKYRAKYVVLPSGKKILLAKFATSGSSLCFPVETIVFWAITLVATRYAAMWLGKPCDLATLMPSIAIYGDDIICPTWAAPTVLEFLELFGFEFNVAKSHYAEWDHYRESCGKEYFGSSDVTTRYFPRKTMEFSNTASSTQKEYPSTVIALCDLQHRMITSNFSWTSDFLCRCIRTIVPDMTESSIGSEYNDIWSLWPHIQKECWTQDSATSQGLVAKYQRDIEYHYTLVVKYSKVNTKLLPYGEALRYNQWLHYGSKLADDPNADLFRILDAPTSPYALTSKGQEVLVKHPY